MITRTNLLLSQAERVKAVEDALLELLTTKSNQVHQLKVEKEAALVEI